MHVSIRKGNSVPKYEQCGTCCQKYHCPLCSIQHYKPTSATKLRSHLKLHFNRAVQHEGYTIHRCGLGCRVQLHYHCMYCQSTVLRKEDFENHLIVCKTKQSTTTPLSKQCSSSPKLCPPSAEPCTPSIEPCPHSVKLQVPSLQLEATRAKPCPPSVELEATSAKPCPPSVQEATRAKPCPPSVQEATRAKPCPPSVQEATCAKPCPSSVQLEATSAKVPAPGTKQFLPSVEPSLSSAKPCMSSAETCPHRAEEADLEIHALKRVRVRPVVREKCYLRCFLHLYQHQKHQ
ncbi:hypothetical protein AMEX_G310 [Astyanax mexicanus]|uniref:Uncharacterized protein n=1 Tax=Astyanax mexicanus TaxID=7994 RepID=A0A8T2MJT7_ASTMX|nr:hypothetical protein AMEX_G310 [Astyanax mexicanus]